MEIRPVIPIAIPDVTASSQRRQDNLRQDAETIFSHLGGLRGNKAVFTLYGSAQAGVATYESDTDLLLLHNGEDFYDIDRQNLARKSIDIFPVSLNELREITTSPTLPDEMLLMTSFRELLIAHLFLHQVYAQDEQGEDFLRNAQKTLLTDLIQQGIHGEKIWEHIMQTYDQRTLFYEGRNESRRRQAQQILGLTHEEWYVNRASVTLPTLGEVVTAYENERLRRTS